jgi:hypothetical protein
MKRIGDGLQIWTRNRDAGFKWGGLALLVLPLFTGCERALPPAEYLKRYETEALTQKITGGYRISVMPLSSDYLLAQQMDSTWGQTEVHEFQKTYEQSIYLSVRISASEPSGGPDDLQKDILGGAMLQGQGAYQSRLQFLQTGLADYARLELPDGSQISPLSYRFQRGFGLGGAQSFLFLFPKEKAGVVLRLPGSRFVLRDFGLDTGTLTIPLRAASMLVLKV